MILVVAGLPFMHEEAFGEMVSLFDELNEVQRVREVVHCARPGVDTFADRWASLRAIDRRAFPVMFDSDGFAARVFSTERLATYVGKIAISTPVTAMIFGNSGVAAEVNKKLQRVSGVKIRIYSQGSINECGGAVHGDGGSGASSPAG